MRGEQLIKQCAEMLDEVKHEPDCNTATLGRIFPCTCKARTERVVAGLAALLSWTAFHRGNIRDWHTEKIHEKMVAHFRKAARAEIGFRLVPQFGGPSAPAEPRKVSD